jgi:putative transposase
VFVFEDLKTSNMTRIPKPKQNEQDEQGKYLPNQAKAKAGLNKSILNAGWHYLESFTKYKANQAGKAFFKVSAAYTSQ